MSKTDAAHRIEKFLADYDEGRVLVAVGYASAAGLGWLNEQTQGRPVSLIIGNTSPQYWTKCSESDARSALSFLGRSDVEVLNWYRGRKSKAGPAMAHLKAWVIEHDGRLVTALVGSANLTKQGLSTNVETMAEATRKDAQRTWTQIKGLRKKAWDCEERLRGYLAPHVGAADGLLPMVPAEYADSVDAYRAGYRAGIQAAEQAVSALRTEEEST